MIKKLIICLLIPSFFVGCSLTKRKVVADKSVTTHEEQKESVPLEKYQDLLIRHQELQKQYQELLKGGGTNSALLTETVDLSQNRDKEPMQELIKQEAPPVEKELDEVGIEKASEDLTNAINMVSAKKYSEAMSVLQRWENAPNKQIQVRAKYFIGEVLWQQKEFDLAMQMFEVVVTDFGFSGYALKSLEKLALCAKELGLKAKYERYHSLMQEYLNGDLH